MYIQTKMAEYAEELWEMMQDEKTHVYMCGLKGMERRHGRVLRPYCREERHRLDRVCQGHEEG